MCINKKLLNNLFTIFFNYNYIFRNLRYKILSKLT